MKKSKSTHNGVNLAFRQQIPTFNAPKEKTEATILGCESQE